MNNVDIFSAAKEKVMPEWAKFVNPEDKVQGTYVGKIVGQKDGYGNEQIIYQLLQDDGKIINVGFGLNKKVLHQDMAAVKFGAIVGFRYLGTIQVKNRVGQMVNVKDFALHQDPKIVNEVWLAENKDSMPQVVRVEDNGASASTLDEEFPDDAKNDVPFSSAGSLTNEDKLAAITKMAKEKLGATTDASVKEKVMETTGIAFIPVNFDKISAALAAL